MDRLARVLAARLREESRRRRFSLRKLAEASGLSPTTVHQIEAGRGSPSLATLQALASTLGVPLAALFESGPPVPEPAVLLPARERPRTTTSGGSLEGLATGLSGQRLRGLLVTLAPGGDTGEEPMTHPGLEPVFGLAGRCGYAVAGREYRVGPGDSLVVDSTRPIEPAIQAVARPDSSSSSTPPTRSSPGWSATRAASAIVIAATPSRRRW